MGDNLKEGLVNRMLEVGAYDVKIADPSKGFDYVTELERHPLSLMPECKSVISFIIPRSGLLDLWYLGHRRPKPQLPDYWTRRQIDKDNAPIYIVYRVFTLITSFIMLKAINFLNQQGFNAIEKHEKEDSPLPLEKLYAYEAGIGVYGKSGLILHPELGNRIGIGSILTDAVLTPDGRLMDFDPCSDCDLCIRTCPAQAFGLNGDYHNNWSEELCTTTRYKLKIMGTYCNTCWDVCTYGKYDDSELFFMNLEMNKHVRELQHWTKKTLKYRVNLAN